MQCETTSHDAFHCGVNVKTAHRVVWVYTVISLLVVNRCAAVFHSCAVKTTAAVPTVSVYTHTHTHRHARKQ